MIPIVYFLADLGHDVFSWTIIDSACPLLGLIIMQDMLGTCFPRLNVPIFHSLFVCYHVKELLLN